jgi:ABC-type branched-subunit amino acid transport system substrate-binding protein
VRAFSDGFGTLFKSFWGTGGLSLPGSLAILSYDATNLLLVAVEKNLQMAHSDVVIPTVQEITVAIREFTNQQPFMGLGGSVGFSNTNHQPNKALGIYELLPIPNAPTNAPVVQLQLATVVGGKALFCGHATNCTPY